MNTYLYELTHYAQNAEMTVKANDARFIIDTLLNTVEMGDHVDVISGLTGEVLCAQNCDDPIMEEGFGLMVLGRLMERVWG